MYNGRAKYEYKLGDWIMSSFDIQSKQYCHTCKIHTNHHIVTKNGEPVQYVEEILEDDDYVYGEVTYAVVQCKGCDTIGFLRIYNDMDNWQYAHRVKEETGKDIDPNDYYKYPEEPKKESAPIPYNHYESKIKFKHLPEYIKELRSEAIKAYKEDLLYLCATGIRMLVEAICKEKGIPEYKKNEDGSLQTYKDGNPIPNSIKWKIDELHKRGFIQESARDILHQVREMGNASAHDIEKHDLRTIRSALETVELILYTIYELPNQKIYERKTKQNPEDMKGSN